MKDGEPGMVLFFGASADNRVTLGQIPTKPCRAELIENARRERIEIEG